MTHFDPDDLPELDTAADEPLDAELRALIARADAAPTLRPTRDLWPGIAARLDGGPSSQPADPAGPLSHDRLTSAGSVPTDVRVLAFRARSPEHAPPRTVERDGPAHRWRWLAAAAVALVTVSSGATYLATRAASTPSVARTAAPVAERPTDRDRIVASRAAIAPAPTLAATVQRDGPRARSAVHAVARSVDAVVPGVADYDREIAALRAVVVDGRGDLDSATVDVLARNLRIIDAAIAASRAALARDPHSPFLGEQLTRALGQKVDLLRTAALLPRT